MSVCCRPFFRLIPARHFLGVMGFLGLANAYTMRVILSVAITDMVIHRAAGNSTRKVDPNACPEDKDFRESISRENAGEFDWNEETQGLILSAFFWGYIVTHLPGGLLSEKFGGKHVLGFGILLTAILTLVTPFGIRIGGWHCLLIIRVFEGLGEGPTFPALNALLAEWAPPQERGYLGSLVFSGSLIGTIVGNSLSGIIIESFGWPSVFYVFGMCTVIWYLIWLFMCFSSPNTHPYISEKEKEFMSQSFGNLNKKKSNLRHIPWKQFFKSVPLWGLIFAQIGHDWGFFSMVTDLPKYMSDVLKFKISHNGVLSSLPYLMMWIVSIGSGILSDWIIKKQVWSTTTTRKFFTVFAAIGPAVFLLAASYAGCHRMIVVGMFTIGMATMGTFYPGMKVNALDLSPNYAGSLMAIVNGMGSITGILAPYLIGVIAWDSTLLQWRIVFWICAGILTGTSIAFLLMASGETQPWNEMANPEN